jgi:hypothetical protein
MSFLYDASKFVESRRPLYGEGEFVKSLSGLPRGAGRHAKEPKTYTVSYTYTKLVLKMQ